MTRTKQKGRRNIYAWAGNNSLLNVTWGGEKKGEAEEGVGLNRISLKNAARVNSIRTTACVPFYVVWHRVFGVSSFLPRRCFFSLFFRVCVENKVLSEKECFRDTPACQACLCPSVRPSTHRPSVSSGLRRRSSSVSFGELLQPVSIGIGV